MFLSRIRRSNRIKWQSAIFRAAERYLRICIRVLGVFSRGKHTATEWPSGSCTGAVLCGSCAGAVRWSGLCGSCAETLRELCGSCAGAVRKSCGSCAEKLRELFRKAAGGGAAVRQRETPAEFQFPPVMMMIRAYGGEGFNVTILLLDETVMEIFGCGDHSPRLADHSCGHIQHRGAAGTSSK